MSDTGNNPSRSRKIFNVALTLIQPPEPRFDKEWPKKPPFWQIYGTPVTKIYWKMILGFGAFSAFLMGATAYIQPKVSLGIFDRYFLPEMFYTGEQKEKWIEQQYERLAFPPITYDSYTRDGSFEETTKQYRERLESLDTALNSQKVFRSAAL
ncbi:uncharacterized protein LOC128389361 [Panonychus citri]|uniref:uncharacterized protein LOC128389030 n=1 Tax=Panonychus citri TaxID=50023 RepID=UPI0023076F7C|nr:uncharacterized protein LOC128389030 [Panonychus citri]XP_053204898.1 uncharacterized protein LOC128389361 [Panonychus citri]